MLEKIKTIFVLLWLAIRYYFTLLFWPISSRLFKSDPSGYKLYFNGDFIGAKSTNPNAGRIESVVTKGDRIEFVGSLAEAKQFVRGRRAERINLNGKTLSPGFIDPHLHPSMAAVILSTHFITPFDWSFPWISVKGVRTEQDYRHKLEELVENVSDDWIITWGYHKLFHGEISRKILDTICPDKPLVVWHRSFHDITLNTKARDQCGVLYEDVKANPQVHWDDGDFIEKGMEELLKGQEILLRLIPKLESGYDRVSNVIEDGGITTVADLEYPMFNEWLEYAFATLKLAGKSRKHFTVAVPSSRVYGKKFNGDHLKAIEKIREISNSFDGMKDSNFAMYRNHVKIIADGAFFSLNMQMQESFTNGSTGEWMTKPDDINTIFDYYWRAGFQIHVHTNGDKAMQLVIDNVKRMSEICPRIDHKTTIEHAGYFTENQADDLATLGCLVSAQPFYFYALSEIYSQSGLGPEKSARISAIKLLTDRGIPTALHSDFTMAPAKPLMQMWVAVNRVTVNGNSGNPDLCLEVEKAYDAVTITAAKILGFDHKIGSIESGKLANFVVLNENPLKVDKMKIKDVKVLRTIYKGQL